ncbi:DnaA family protein [gamma proteobacterium HdN1]|nr:DnaA family protein [gamma proteobacterium HdN1]
MYRQLSLDFGQPASGRFEDFFVGENAQVVERLRQLPCANIPAFLVVWGGTGAGKTHLANALCDAFSVAQRRAILIDGQQKAQLFPAMLDGLAAVDLVVVDDLDQFAGDAVWEEALFHLYNKMVVSKASLLVTLSCPPMQAPFRLADLKSRLGACETYRVVPLSHEDKREWMRQMARLRSFELEAEWCDYILNRAARDPASLVQIINTLDAESLAAKRMMSLPFIKQVMKW